MGDQYYVDEYDEEPDMDELNDYMSPDEGDGDLAGFERPEMNVDFSTAVVVSNLPKVCVHLSFIFPCHCDRLFQASTHHPRLHHVTPATNNALSAHREPKFHLLPASNFQKLSILLRKIPAPR